MNMKHFYISLLLLAASLGLHAAVLHVGYCEEQIAIKGQSAIGNTTVSAALVFPADMLAPYKGAKVEAVRVGLVTATGIQNLTVWVRDSLRGANLAGSNAAITPEQGWNEVGVDGSLVIGDQPLTVGYSFQQSKSVKCISAVGDDHPDGLYVGRVDASGETVWKTISNNGTLSVELVVSRDDFPATDLELISVSQNPLPVHHGDDVTLTLKVRNRALTPINGFSYAAEFSGMEPITAQCAETINPCCSKEIAMLIPAASQPEVGITPLKVSVAAVGDECAQNDAIQLRFGSYDTALNRTVLIEEFTTEQCGNCPRAINTLAQCKEEFGDRIAIVAHHAGYYTDFLTTDDDKALTWFYNPEPNGTFAPAGMLDRTPQDGSIKGYTSAADAVTASIGYYETYKQVVEKALAVPAFVTIDATYSYDADTRTYAVDVAAEKSELLDLICPEPQLSLYVVEDSILHQHQAGISGTFYHNHAYRQSITSLWGDAATFNGNALNAHYEYVLPQDYDANHVEIVAFIHGMDRAARTTGCRVMNTAIAHPLAASIETLATGNSEASAPVYYDLMGRRVANPVGGLFIRVAQGKRTKVAL